MERLRRYDGAQWEDAAFLALITAMALLMRLCLFPFESGDYHQFLQGWYEALRENGGFAAVGMEIGDYMPTYLYLLAPFTYFPVSGLTAIKLVSSAADIVLAVYVRRLVRLRCPDPLCGVLSYAAVLFLPSVFLNSAVWGQCDAIFTAALAAFVYYAMQDRPGKAVTAYAIAFVFKLQAVFLAPLLLFLLLRGKIRPVHLLRIPIVYFLAVLPAAVRGRSLWKLLTVYVAQAGQYDKISMFLPNLYTWLPDENPSYLGTAGVLFAGAAVLTLLFVLCRKEPALTDETMVSLALLFALLVPFLLPYMHERYYFVADIFSLVFAFYFPKKLFVAVVTQLSSVYAVCHNLFGTDFFPVQLLGAAMLGIVIVVAGHTLRLAGISGKAGNADG